MDQFQQKCTKNDNFYFTTTTITKPWSQNMPYTRENQRTTVQNYRIWHAVWHSISLVLNNGYNFIPIFLLDWKLPNPSHYIWLYDAGYLETSNLYKEQSMANIKQLHLITSTKSHHWFSSRNLPARTNFHAVTALLTAANDSVKKKK